MKVTRLLAPIALGALVLTGCGSQTADSDSTAAVGSPGQSTDASTESTNPADDASAEGEDTSAAAAEGSVTITDAQDREVEVPVNPETVVVMDWSVIRTMADLGVEADAVPQTVSALPADLAAYSDIQTVGTVFEPDYETISSLEPDLVIVGGRSGNPEVVAEFEKFAPAVLDLSVRTKDPSQVFEVTSERVNQIGSIFGLSEEADTLMAGLTDQIATVKEGAANVGTAMVVQVSDGTVAAYGPGSRFASVYEDFGFTPTQAPLDGDGSHGEEISQEFFVQYNPAVLFVLDRAKAIGEEQTPALEVLENGMVGTTDASKNEKIVEIDGFAWYLAPNAPSSWQSMIDDVSKAL